MIKMINLFNHKAVNSQQIFVLKSSLKESGIVGFQYSMKKIDTISKLKPMNEINFKVIYLLLFGILRIKFLFTIPNFYNSRIFGLEVVSTRTLCYEFDIRHFVKKKKNPILYKTEKTF